MKTYKGRHYGNIVTVIFMDDRSVVYENAGSRTYASRMSFDGCYYEYKEPRRVKRFLNIYENEHGEIITGGVYPTRESCVNYGMAAYRNKYLGVWEVEWVEGQTQMT